MESTFRHSGSLKAEVHGVLRAPLAVVTELAFTRLGAPAANGDGPTVDLDVAEHAIALRGGWWYRGEYHFDEHEEGTLVRHRVYNVAGARSRWAVPLANRFFLGYATDTRLGFTETLKTLAEELNCEFYVLPATV